MSDVVGHGVVEVFFEPNKASLAGLKPVFVDRLKGIGGAGGVALAAGIGAAVAGAKGLYEVGQVFKEMQNTIIRTTGESGKALKRLESDARAVGRNTPSSFKDIATAIAQLHARTGDIGVPLRELTRNVLNLSRITGTDLQGNIAASTRMFHDWKIATDDQAGALDKVYRAAQLTGANVTTLMQQVVKFGSPLRQLGFTFDQTVALFAQFEQAGVNIQTAMPGLRMGLKNIVNLQQNAAAARTSVKVAEEGLATAIKTFGKNSPEAIQAQQKLSAAQDTLRLSSLVAGKSIPQALATVEKAIKRTGDAGQANALAMKVFGTRAGPDLAAAIREGHFSLTGLIKAMHDSKGAIDKADESTRTWSDNWQIIKNNMLLALRPLGSAVFLGFEKTMEKLAQVTPGFAKHVLAFSRAIKQTFQQSGLGDVFKQLGDTLQNELFPALRRLEPVVKPIAKIMLIAFGANTIAAIKGVALSIQGIARTVSGVINLISDIVHGRWSKIWGDLKQIASGQILQIKAAFTAVFGGFVGQIVQRAFGKVVAAFKDGWGKAKSATASAFGAIKGATSSGWNKVKSVTSSLFGKIKSTVSAGWDHVKSASTAGASKIKNGVSDLWNKVRSGTSSAWGKIKSVVSSGWSKLNQVTGGQANNVLHKLQDLWGREKRGWQVEWSFVKHLALAGWEALKRAWNSGTSAVKRLTSAAVNAIKRTWTAFWNAVKTLTSRAWSEIKSRTSSALNTIRGLMNSAFRTWQTLWRNLWNVTQRVVSAGWNTVKNVTSSALSFLRSHATSVLNSIGSTFKHIFTSVIPGAVRAGVNALRTIWNGIKSAFSGPISAVEGVINKFIGGINKILGAVGAGHIPGFSGGGVVKKKSGASTSGRKKASGGVLPGFTPGRDVHTFISPTGGILHLSGGEAIMRPEFTRRVGGARGVELINRAARTGRFAKGGVYPTPHSGSLDSNDTGNGRYSRDISVPVGTLVHAYKAGIVAAVKHLKTSYGNYVAIKQKGGGEAIYAHLSKTLVRLHQHIKKGQVIGRSGSTGNSTGPHLHFEIRSKGAAQLAGGGGGASGSGGGGQSFWDKVSSAVGKVVGSAKDLIAAGLKKIGLPTSVPGVGGKGVVHKMLQGIVSKVWHGVINFAKNAIGGAEAKYVKKHPNAGSGAAGVGKISGKGAGAYKKYAFKQFKRLGWNKKQRAALVALWNRESGWRANARNPKSGAYGIPQALPASKIPGGYHSTAKQQIDWGLGYIKGRYGTPKRALAHENKYGWYDSGGMLGGTGMFFKGTQQPERVLSPQQTAAFDELVQMLTTTKHRAWFPNLVQVQSADNFGRPNADAARALINRVELVVDGQRFPAYVRGIADGAVGDALDFSARRGRMR